MNSTRPASRGTQQRGRGCGSARQLAVTLTSITSWKVLGSICASGVNCPSTPALPRKPSSLPQRSWIEAPSRSIAGKSRRSTGTRVAVAAGLLDLVVGFFQPAHGARRQNDMRARFRQRDGAGRGRCRATRAVTSAMRPSRGLVMGSFLGHVRQQRQLAGLPPEMSVSEMDNRRRKQASQKPGARALRSAWPMARVEAVHRDESQAVGADELAHLLHVHLVGQQLISVGRVHAIEAAMGGRRRRHPEVHFGGRRRRAPSRRSFSTWCRARWNRPPG